MFNLILIGPGDNIHTIRWANGFANLGWNVNIISANKKVNILHYQHKNVNCDTIEDYIGINDSDNFIGRVKKYLLLRNKIKRSNYSILHIHSITSYTILLTGLKNTIVSLWGKDIIWDYDRTEPIIKKWIKKSILKRSINISTTSNFLKETAVSYIPTSAHKIRVIPFGVNIDLFSPKREKFSDSVVKICFVKHLEEKYGPMLLLHAFKLLNEKFDNIELRLLGDGSLRSEVENMISVNNLSSSVKLLGKLPHEEIIKELDEADIFVMPSIYKSESFGVAAVEASAMELPIIVTDIGGVPEVIKHNKTGFLIEAGNVKQISDNIEKILNDTQLGIDMGKAGRKFVKKLYNWDQNLDQMRSYYEYIMNK